MIRKMGLLASALFVATMANPSKNLYEDTSSIKINPPGISSPLELSLIEENLKYREYNYTEFTYDSPSNIYDLKENLWSNAESIRWLLDIPNKEPNGTHFEVLEERISNQLSIPIAFSVDDHWYYGIVDESKPHSKAAVKSDFFDKEGYKIATNWINRNDPSFFDITTRFMKSFLPEEIENYVPPGGLKKNSGYGPRKIWINGGSNDNFHYGIDIAVPVGTLLFNPTASETGIGYDETAGYFSAHHFKRYFWERGKKKREETLREIYFGFFHYKEHSEEIFKKFEESNVNKAFIEKMRNVPSEQLYRELLGDKKRTQFYSGTQIFLEQGEQLGKSGWTGSSTEPHVHFEIAMYLHPKSYGINTYKDLDLQTKEPLENKTIRYYMDAEKFMDSYMIKKETTPEIMKPIAEKIQGIIQYKILHK